MWEFVVEWFKDPVVQGLVLSPLIGAVMGVVLGLLVSAPPPSAPIKVQETRIVFVQQIYANRQGNNNEIGAAIFILGGILVVGVTWVYARWAKVGLDWWMAVTLMFLTFNFFAALVGLIRGGLSKEWLLYIAFPIVGLFGSIWLASLADERIIAGVSELSSKSGMMYFYMHQINIEQRHWILMQGLGVLLGMAGTLASAFRVTHYVALANQRGANWWASIWRLIAFVTRSGSGGIGLSFIIVLYCGSWFFLSGSAYKFLMQSIGR